MQRIQDMMLRALAWAQVRRMEAAEDGQTMVEYALLVALISIVAIGALILLGDNIKAIFDDVAECLGAPADCAA